MRFAQLGLATEAYADKSGDNFGLSFQLSNIPDITVILDRPTLERLQHQIAFALSPQMPPVADQKD